MPKSLTHEVHLVVPTAKKELKNIEFGKAMIAFNMQEKVLSRDHVRVLSSGGVTSWNVMLLECWIE